MFIASHVPRVGQVGPTDVQSSCSTLRAFAAPLDVFGGRKQDGGGGL